MGGWSGGTRGLAYYTVASTLFQDEYLFLPPLPTTCCVVVLHKQTGKGKTFGEAPGWGDEEIRDTEFRQGEG